MRNKLNGDPGISSSNAELRRVLLEEEAADLLERHRLELRVGVSEPSGKPALKSQAVQKPSARICHLIWNLHQGAMWCF